MSMLAYKTKGPALKRSQKNAAGCRRSSGPIQSGHRPWNITFLSQISFLCSSSNAPAREVTPISLPPPLLSLEQEDSRQAESGCRGQRRQWQMDLIYEDNQNLDCQEKRKKIRSHMTKFVPSRWPFWVIVRWLLIPL